MSSFQAIALYDFATKVRGELPFHTNDIMTVTSVDVGNGWWEAKNSEGTIGLIPKSYFKVQTKTDLQCQTASTSPQKSTSSSSSSSSIPFICLPPRPPPKPLRQHVPCSSIEQDFMKKADDYIFITSLPFKTCTNVEKHEDVVESDDYDDDDDDDDEDDEDLEEFRTSKFVGLMTGSTDLYLFEVNPSPLPEDVQTVSVTGSPDGPVWSPTSSQVYSCRIGSPKKEKKFRGIKSFTSYKITTTGKNAAVYRRYKHFDWLHTQLTRKFLTLLVPPLPCKQISGRFEEEFINSRLRQLEMWLTRMCKHPIISQSEVFKLFIHCGGVEEWKTGKRHAERDKFKGAFFYYTVKTPSITLDPISIELKLDKFERFVRCMDDSIKHFLGVCHKVAIYHRCKFRKEFCKLGKSFDDLSKSFELDLGSESKKLSSALSYTGKTYNEIGMLFGVQPSRDLDQLMEALKEYKGILSVFPDILLVQRSVTNKIQETAGQLSRLDVNRVQGRANVITFTLLAEMHHFQENRISDFSKIMQNYLQTQIDFYKQVTSKLEHALKQYRGKS